MYFAIKHTHLTLVLVSICLFYFRFVYHKVMAKPLPKLLKILPHIIDTLLLMSALVLCIMIKQYPFIDHWLTVKFLFVLSYIGCAIVAMKATSKPKSYIALALSTFSLMFVIHIAITKTAF